MMYLCLVVLALTISHGENVVILTTNSAIRPENVNQQQYILQEATGIVDETTFSSFRKLQGLQISNSDIADITNNAFISTPLLEYLEISRNNRFPSPNLRHLKKLTVLKFIDNQNSVLGKGALSGLKNLTTLKIQKQDYKEITRDLFAGANRIADLSLVENGIEYVEADAFSNLPDLISLYLHHNKIRHFLPNTFGNQKKLVDLQIHSNLLGNVDWEIFDRIMSLMYLNIAENSMSRLNIGNLLLAFPTLTSLNYMPNDFTCPTELVILKDIRHYRITKENFGSENSSCAEWNYNSPRNVVFAD